MSSQQVVINTGNKAIINTDTGKLFVFRNEYSDFPADYTNSTYNDITWPAGTVMGRATTGTYAGKVIPLATDATDGSQFPVGILAEDVIIESGETLERDLSLCVAGDVVESRIVLPAGDTLADVISSRQLRDRIAADTVGINLVGGDQLTGYDNQ